MDSESARPTKAPRQREQWADFAKGACIIFVVLWHVTVKHYLLIQWHVSLPIPGVWGKLGEQLLPLRMPLFFTISGVFAVRAVTRPWRVLLKSRIAKFYYIYSVWLLVHTAVLNAVPDFPTDRATSPLVLLEQFTITPSNLWYIFALAAYFAFAKATRSVPRWIPLVLALGLNIIATANMIPVPGDRGSLIQNLIWFLCGLYFAPYVERLASNATNLRLVLTTVVYLAALAAMAFLGAEFWPGVWAVVSVTAVFFGVNAAARFSRWRLLADPLAELGRRTLPIYVIHMPVLALLHLLLTHPMSRLSPTLQLPVALVYPAVLTALVIALSLGIHRVLMAAHLSWFFALPSLGRKASTAPAATAGGATAPGATMPGAADPDTTVAIRATDPATTVPIRATGAGPAGGRNDLTVVLPVIKQAAQAPQPGPVTAPAPYGPPGSPAPYGAGSSGAGSHGAGSHNPYGPAGSPDPYREDSQDQHGPGGSRDSTVIFPVIR